VAVAVARAVGVDVGRGVEVAVRTGSVGVAVNALLGAGVDVAVGDATAVAPCGAATRDIAGKVQASVVRRTISRLNVRFSFISIS
jgi:hypothetical protein